MKQTHQENENYKYLENWVFIYNPYQGLFMTTNRDNYNKLFSDIESEAILKSSRIETLFEVINLNKGDLRKVISWKQKF